MENCSKCKNLVTVKDPNREGIYKLPMCKEFHHKELPHKLVEEQILKQKILICVITETPEWCPEK